MILPDVNILIYAFRSDMPRHPVCRAWLADVIERDQPFGVSPIVLSAVVRIVSNPKIFSVPSELAEAFAFCDDILVQPHCQLVEPGDNHWRIFKRLCIDTETRGARVSDAWFAALAIEWGCEWVTLDRDFARFPGLKWQIPATV